LERSIAVHSVCRCAILIGNETLVPLQCVCMLHPQNLYSHISTIFSLAASYTRHPN
jgi:hypothetical protein